MKTYKPYRCSLGVNKKPTNNAKVYNYRGIPQEELRAFCIFAIEKACKKQYNNLNNYFKITM